MSTRRRVLIAGGALLALQLALVLAWRARQAPEIPFALGEPAPRTAAMPLGLERSDGSLTDLASVAAGRPVLVHFWATWCPPCREEMPQLLDFAGKSERIVVLPVAVDDTWPAMRRFLEELPRVEAHRASRTADVRRWGVGELPDTVLVDGSGHLVQRWKGPQRWTAEEAVAEVESLLQ